MGGGGQGGWEGGGLACLLIRLITTISGMFHLQHERPKALAQGVGRRGQGARLSKLPNANDDSVPLCVCVCVGGKQSKHNDNDRFANICHVYEQNKGKKERQREQGREGEKAGIGTRITQYRT